MLGEGKMVTLSANNGDNILRMLKQYDFLCMICIVTVMHLFDLMDDGKDCEFY